MLDASLPTDAPVIKVIETTYAGYRFRSRLEARWAVFFDKLGWSWKYEHGGYRIGGYDPINWLPDFEVSVGDREYYVEVKGDPNFFADGEWLERFDFNGGPPNFQYSADPQSKDGKPLIVLGSIPREKKGRLFVPVVAHYKGVVYFWAEITPDGPDLSGLLTCLGYGEGIEDFQPLLTWFDPLTRKPGFSKTPVLEALKAARSARFEHGEKP